MDCRLEDRLLLSQVLLSLFGINHVGVLSFESTTMQIEKLKGTSTYVLFVGWSKWFRRPFCFISKVSVRLKIGQYVDSSLGR